MHALSAESKSGVALRFPPHSKNAGALTNSPVANTASPAFAFFAFFAANVEP